MPEQEINDWVFTFGQNHIWPLTGLTMNKNYVVINGTFHGARNEMRRRFDNRWSSQYHSKDAAGVDKYELAELRLENLERGYRTDFE